MSSAFLGGHPQTDLLTANKGFLVRCLTSASGAGLLRQWMSMLAKELGAGRGERPALEHFQK